MLMPDVAKPCRYEVLPGLEGQDKCGQGDDGPDEGERHDAVSMAPGRQGKSPTKKSRKHKRGVGAEESERESQEVANESLDQLLMMHRRLESIIGEGGGGVREGQEGEEGDATAAGGRTESAREKKTRDKNSAR